MHRPCMHVRARRGMAVPMPLSAQTLHFVDAPHTLPLAPGNGVPMRAWWRNRHHLRAEDPGDADDDRGDGAEDGAPGCGGGGGSGGGAVFDRSAWQSMLELAEEAGWQEVVVGDWKRSREVRV
jgi:hypothetical protein